MPRNEPILSQEPQPSLGLPRGKGSQSFGPSLTAFPGHRQGAGREAGLPGLEPAPIWDPGRARRGPSTTCATTPGPFIFFIGKADIQRGETERKIFHPMIHSPDAMPIRSQEPLPGLPRRCRVPKLWAVLDCFPGPQAGSWKGSGAASIEPVPIWDPGCARRGP